MNKKVFILIIIVLLLAAFNILQYDKMSKTDLEHELEMDSLYKYTERLDKYTERLETQLDILTEFLAGDSTESAKDFEAE